MLEEAPFKIPIIEAKVIELLFPVPSVNVTPSLRVVAARVIMPVAVPPRFVSAKIRTGVRPPNLSTLVLAFAAIVPDKYFVLGASAVRPFVKTKVPPLAPRAKVPVLLKVTASVIVPVLALRAKLYAWDAVVKVVAVRAPLKAIVPVVLERVTVVALTAPLKVVPPELVMVRVPMSVPIVLLTATAPVVLIVILEVLPESVPATELRLIALLIPVPKVKVTLSAKVVAPRLIAPVAVSPTVVFARTLTAVVPRLRTLEPVLALIVPAKYLVVGTIAVKPPANVKVSPPLPKYSAPEVPKVVALVILVVLPYSLSAKLPALLVIAVA